MCGAEDCQKNRQFHCYACHRPCFKQYDQNMEMLDTKFQEFVFPTLYTQLFPAVSSQLLSTDINGHVTHQPLQP